MRTVMHSKRYQVDDWDSPGAFDDIQSLDKDRTKKVLSVDSLTMECIDAQVIAPKGFPKIKLILYDAKTQTEAVKFFPCQITPKKFISTAKNSDFAKIYRLTIGEDPGNRLTRSDQLMSHLIGYEFNCIVKSASYSNNDPYNKVKAISPLNIIITDNWTASGHFRSKRKKRKKIEQQNNINKVKNSNKKEVSHIPTPLINTRPTPTFQSEVRDKPIRVESSEVTLSIDIDNAIWHEYKTGELDPYFH